MLKIKWPYLYAKWMLFCIVLIFSQVACHETNTVQDIDGNLYHTVQIGKQIWMTENLKTTRFNNGDSIQHIQFNTLWEQSHKASFCCYNNDTNCIKTYGYLYNWFCVNDYRNIAPKGWRIPTEEDIRTLESYLHADTITGTLLKQAGNINWLPFNTVGNNSTGFTAMPSGYRDKEGQYYMLRSNGYYWTINGSFEFYHWSSRMFQAFADVRRDSVFKNYGFSIRCIKDTD